MPKPMPAGRRPEDVRKHYEVERELADRLRASTPAERRHLYTSVYDELYRRVPEHPQLTRKRDDKATAAEVGRLLPALLRFADAGSTFLEIGPGDCSLSLAMAGRVARCYGVDVSTEITSRPGWPPNFELVISDGSSIPVPPATVDLAYSNQLMEHLHPDDARLQLSNIHQALRPGGRYVCRTPSRLSGPHDVSAHFDEVATGFHLREYTNGELAQMFREAGFRAVEAFCIVRGDYRRLSLAGLRAAESLLEALPRRIASRLASQRPVPLLLGVNLVGTA